MNKIAISAILILCINLCYSQESKEINLNLTAGDHLIKATKKANASFILTGIGSLLFILPLVTSMDANQAKPVAVMGGVFVTVGFVLNISAWQQFGKAGRKLK